jgi:NAD(P)-dependent dehydrogenase (short-subunit alcohol dehydrogenase family)
MDLELTGKKALITGSTAGIGFGIASPLKRFATPVDDVAMVVHVCSRRPSANNGAALRVDGGVVRSIV